ncbi:hypothetical protein JXB41_00650 [Candidatus Woesearchaeota archaeon]|nr:hypothetical protein [Candidatus Woesearchaeota archaeon]
MKLKKPELILVLIFSFALFTRLFFAFQTQYFSDDNSYFFLRQIEHIKKTGMPLYEDELSYRGREVSFMPLYYYILSFFTIFLPPALVGKILPNLFISTGIIVIYMVSFQITRNKYSSLMAAVMSAFIPIILFETVNSINIYSIVLPCTFLFIYFFMNLEKETTSISYLLILLFVLIASSSLSFLLIFSLLIYLLFCYLEKIKNTKKEMELILFSLFFFLWANFIVFKKAFQLHGLKLIWQNLPQFMFDRYFTQINLWEAIYSIGLVPLLFGVIIVYNYLFKKKSKTSYLLISICLSIFLLSWLKLINILDALVFLSTTLTILSALFIKQFNLLIKKTKISKYQNIFILIFLILISLTSILPGILYSYEAIENSPSSEDIEPFLWIENNTDKNSVILTTIREGHLLSYFGKRKNVIDSNFLLIPNINVRINDTSVMYTTNYKINALQMLLKYDVNYILFSEKAEEDYLVQELPYFDNDCFTLEYNKSAKIYRLNCALD